MNETERAQLVGLLMQFHISTKAARGTREELACLNTTIDEIDRLLAAGTAPGLDELLDSVGADAWVDVDIAVDDNEQPTGGWIATVAANNYRYHGGGSGPTRMAAIRNAVAQAAGITPGDARERE